MQVALALNGGQDLCGPAPTWALVELGPALAQQLVAFRAAAAGVMRIDGFNAVSISDRTPDFWDGLELNDRLEDNATYICVRDSRRIRTGGAQPVRMEYVNLLLTDTGVRWEGTVRHADVPVETVEIPWLVIEEARHQKKETRRAE